MEALKLYIKDIKDIPLLSPTDELKVAKRVKKGDAHARRVMIRSNLRLVINIAKQYSNFGVPLLDLKYDEDSRAEVDMNVVCTGDGRFIELQGTAEGEPFTRDQMEQLIALAGVGVETLFAAQRAALEETAR